MGRRVLRIAKEDAGRMSNADPGREGGTDRLLLGLDLGFGWEGYPAELLVGIPWTSNLVSDTARRP